ncbi:MAG: aldehyde dehydrogenase family protein [Polyangiaceae bacterium]
MTTLTVDNPFTGDVACTVPVQDDAAISTLLDSAKRAARDWKRVDVDERIALCERAVAAMEADKESIAADITRMMGKPLGQARNEVGGMAGRARHMMSIAKASLADVPIEPKDGFERRIVKDPLGVVLDLPAWNYPLLTAVNAAIPAILAGNAVVMRHAPRTPLCADHFARAFEKAGAPLGLFQPMHTDHATTERTVGDARVDHVVFTGSVYGGHRVQEAAAKRFLHVGLELGGNDPAYVAPDCDFAQTVENLVDGAIYNAGQSCCAVERVYVHESLYDKFVAAVEPLVRAYVLGDPMDPKTNLGPIAQPHHPAVLEALVFDAKQKGAKVVCGGAQTKVDGKGRFFQATLVADVTDEMKLFQTESFGPILAIGKVTSDEEALQRMNRSELGLTASVWTSDRERAARFANDLEFGTVLMNRCDSVDPALPWTGVKNSGRGVSLSALGFDQLTQPKSIHFRLRF